MRATKCVLNKASPFEPRIIFCAVILCLPLESHSTGSLVVEKLIVTTNLLRTANTSPKSTCATFESAGTISCIYLDWGGAATRVNLYEILSKDGGDTWGSPVGVTWDPGDEFDPFIEYDPVHKRLWLAYAKWHNDRGAAHNDVLLRHKDCPECDWSAAVRIAGDGANDYWIPSVVSLKDGAILVLYSKNGQESTFGDGSGTIELTRSIDVGKSWGTPITVPTVCDAEYARAIQNTFGSILLVYSRYVDSSHLPKGTKCADGTINKFPYSDIHQARSSDGGRSWTGDSILYHTANGSALHPFIGVENPRPAQACAACRWDLFFVESADGRFAAYRMQSSDQGLHWTEPSRYSKASWKSPFNIDPGFTEGCKGAIANFTSGFGTDAIYVHRENTGELCAPK
jgi:hypothetical protein